MVVTDKLCDHSCTSTFQGNNPRTNDCEEVTHI